MTGSHCLCQVRSPWMQPSWFNLTWRASGPMPTLHVTHHAFPYAPSGSELKPSNANICFVSRSPSQASALCTFGHPDLPLKFGLTCWLWDLWEHLHSPSLAPPNSEQPKYTHCLSFIFPCPLACIEARLSQLEFSFLDFEKIPQARGFTPWLHYAQFPSAAPGSWLGMDKALSLPLHFLFSPPLLSCSTLIHAHNTYIYINLNWDFACKGKYGIDLSFLFLKFHFYLFFCECHKFNLFKCIIHFLRIS